MFCSAVLPLAIGTSAAERSKRNIGIGGSKKNELEGVCATSHQIILSKGAGGGVYWREAGR